MKENKKKHDEAVELVAKSLYQQALEDEKNEIYPKESIWPDFKKEIQSHGYECEIQSIAEYICNNNPDEFRDIIIKYYQKCTIDKEKSFLISCLINKKNAELTSFVLSEFEKMHNHKGCMFNDMIANFINKTCNIKYKNLYIEILKKKEISKDLTYIFVNLDRLKIDEVKNILIDYYYDEELIHCDPYFKFWVIKSLSKYKDKNLLHIFQENLNNEDKEIRKVCEKAIEKISKAKE